jgi:adenine phosphoribosyltransferase
MSLNLLEIIRTIPDFPKPGISFKDITPVLGHPQAFKQVIDTLAARYANQGITKVVGIESRGFLFGAPLALSINAGFVPIRKPGKLPAATISRKYELEYGTDAIEMHSDAVAPNDKVLVVDDVVATGGTLAAACELIEDTGATLHEAAVIIELTFLPWRDKVGQRPLFSLVQY